MYHRYMPTENGQYQRKNVPETRPSYAPPPRQPRPASAQESKQQEPPQPPADKREQQRPPGAQELPPPNRLKFLEKLLPGMDSGDVLVLLILLFLISEGNEDSSSVIMTLAIFLFLQ